MMTALRRGLRLVTAVVVAAAVVAACSEDRRFPTADDLDGDFTPAHVVTVDGDGFSPAELEITSGEVVLLANEGDEDHSFSAEERFDTGLLRPGEEVTLVLEEPGEIPYRDRTTGHEATITVRPSP